MVLLEILQYVERQQHHDSSHTGHDVPSKTIWAEMKESIKTNSSNLVLVCIDRFVLAQLVVVDVGARSDTLLGSAAFACTVG